MTQSAHRPPLAPRLWSRLSHASRFSHTSTTLEADDELSSTSTGPTHTPLSSGTMSFDAGYGSAGDSNGHHSGNGHLNGRAGSTSLLPPRYPDEDTRPTSRKELAGWYAYAFAAEVYVICGIGSFIPILLESLARENGVLLSDKTTPCGSSSDRGTANSGQCVVYVLGLEINTASFAMYTFSVSVLLQALLVVSISCAADHGNFRKKLLLSFAWVGSFSVMLYIFVSKSVYIFGAVLAIVSNVSFGASFVLLNSFLPLLVRNHPAIRSAVPGGTLPDVHDESTAQEDSDAEEEEEEEEDLSDSTAALLAGDSVEGYPIVRVNTHEELTSLELSLSTQISAKGIGIGYMAGLFLQCVAILILVRMRNSTWSQRIVLFIIGAWWALFTVPAALWLRPRPGPPLAASRKGGGGGRARAWIAYTVFAWKALFRTVQLARRLVDIVLFLCAWFLLSDAIATTSSTAILFAKTQLHMKPWALGMINVISTTAGVAGAFSWSFISRKLRLRPHQTILACIALFEIIPVYGLLGYLPFVKRRGVFGLQQPWEMYPLAGIYGFVLGGLSGYCRSLYGELIPPGSEAAFYALYAITDKGSSVFGPAIVGAIVDASGEIRPAFWFLAILVGFPAPLIWFVNVERGKREGEKLAETIEGFKVQLGQGNEQEEEDEEEDDGSEETVTNADR
ncbi:hypothetical protein VTK73DRAFT_3185 [Phialemonium thermophilum]|uniref:Autophagy-related protein n=1 Tax=Phialemonium thermophilum TaxID=223376 RepID=A0ABR3X0D0_9PEZI